MGRELARLRVTGSLTLKRRGRSEASRMTKFAMWDAARRPVTPEFRRRQGSPPKDAPGPFENPMRLIGANAQLSSQNSASEISETHAPPSSVFSLGMLRASTAVSIRSCGHASSASVMFLSLQAAASLAANCSRNFSAMNLL